MAEALSKAAEGAAHCEAHGVFANQKKSKSRRGLDWKPDGI
jgi:hypothetical protein